MINEVKEFILQWNVNYPVDKWWRQKYNIPFNSPDHRIVSFIDISIEYEEEQLFKSIKPNGYIPNSGEWWKPPIEDENLSPEEKIESFKDEFRKLDLSQYDDDGR